MAKRSVKRGGQMISEGDSVIEQLAKGFLMLLCIIIVAGPSMFSSYVNSNGGKF
jgi:hypothetical protein